MKKYISPEIVVVPLVHTQPIAGSLGTLGATFYNEDATGEAMTRESVSPGKNVWDEEW